MHKLSKYLDELTYALADATNIFLPCGFMLYSNKLVRLKTWPKEVRMVAGYTVGTR